MFHKIKITQANHNSLHSKIQNNTEKGLDVRNISFFFNLVE